MQDKSRDNISSMLISTSVVLIFTEITAVIAILIDGVITSRFLGVDAYSGIAMLGPLSGMILMLAGFVSTGCTVSCSQLVGSGKKDGCPQDVSESSRGGTISTQSSDPCELLTYVKNESTIHTR